MKKIHGYTKPSMSDKELKLLATCYKCGHKATVGSMREVGYNVFLCPDCIAKNRITNK